MSDLYDPMDYSLPGSSVCGILQARTLEWGLFPGGSDGKESSCNVVDLGSIPGLGRSWRREQLTTTVFWPGEFHGQMSLASYIVHGIAKSWT